MAHFFMVRLARKSGPLSEDGGDESILEHKAVSKALPILDKFAEELGVTPLSDFLSEDPDAVADLVDDEDEAEEILAKLPPVQWFDPVSALPTLTSLLKHISDGSTTGLKTPAKVVAELKDLEVILKYNITKKAKFRFYREF